MGSWKLDKTIPETDNVEIVHCLLPDPVTALQNKANTQEIFLFSKLATTAARTNVKAIDRAKTSNGILQEFPYSILNFRHLLQDFITHRCSPKHCLPKRSSLSTMSTIFGTTVEAPMKQNFRHARQSSDTHGSDRQTILPQDIVDTVPQNNSIRGILLNGIILSSHKS